MEFKIKNNGKSVWENFIEQNLNVPSFCGGRGSCGKCKILVTEGRLPVTAEDKKVFSKQQLEQGYRLACRAYPESEITIKTVFLEETELVGSKVELGIREEKSGENGLDRKSVV